MSDDGESWEYVPPPNSPLGGGVRVATCPYCSGELRGMFSMGLEPLGRVAIFAPGDPPPIMTARWKVEHAEPLCFEWKTERLKAEDLLDALGEGEDREP